MLRDRAQFRAQQAFVMVWVLYNNENDYTLIGQGLLEIVTDQFMYRYQHYVEVSDKSTNQIFLRSRLQRTNQYERQKSTVIAWSDPQQEIQNHIGVSFEDEKTCDMFWRLICSKIGKNYLQINGRQKLDMPNEKNVRMLIQKIKNSYNLVAYHIINSKAFMEAFWQTLDKLNHREQQGIIGINVLRQLLQHYDPKIMAIILSDPHFQKFLSIYEYESKIDFIKCYKQTAQYHQLIQLTQSARNNIQLVLRAKFVRQCVIDYGKDMMASNMLQQVVKDNETEALITMLNDDYMTKIVQAYKNSKYSNKQQKDKVSHKVQSFFLQAAWVIRIYHIQNTKLMFVQSFYKLGGLSIIGQMLNQGYHKSIQILTCLIELDSAKFITQLTNDYRNNPGNNIVRIIGKQYSTNQNQQYVEQTIIFLKSLINPMLDNKITFQFINKTLTFVIFSCCKYPHRILPLIIFYISQLGTVRSIFQHINRAKYFQGIADLLSKQKLSKKSILLVILIVKLILVQNKPSLPIVQEEEEHPNQNKNRKPQKNHQSLQTMQRINSQFIQTNVFRELLIILQKNLHNNNLVTSSIIQNVRALTTLPFNSFTKTVQQFQFNQKKCPTFFKNYLQKIKLIQEPKKQQFVEPLQFELGRKRVHRTILQQQQQQKYLQLEDKQDFRLEQNLLNKRNSQMQAQMKRIIEITKQIGNKNQDQQELLRKQQLRNRAEKLKAQKKVDDNIGFQFFIQGQNFDQ